jgi:hypothetical protein
MGPAKKPNPRIAIEISYMPLCGESRTSWNFLIKNCKHVRTRKQNKAKNEEITLNVSWSLSGFRAPEVSSKAT